MVGDGRGPKVESRRGWEMDLQVGGKDVGGSDIPDRSFSQRASSQKAAVRPVPSAGANRLSAVMLLMTRPKPESVE